MHDYRSWMDISMDAAEKGHDQVVHELIEQVLMRMERTTQKIYMYIVRFTMLAAMPAVYPVIQLR